jgi:serine/threonine protein kinase
MMIHRLLRLDYDIGEICGVGSFSTVHKVTRHLSGEILAAKFTSREEAEKELSIMSKLPRCDSILQYTDVKFDDSLGSGCVCLIGDFMHGSDLQSALEHRGSFAEEDARRIMLQLLTALKLLDEVGVAHRDIKPENILLPSADDPTEIKLADFGLAGMRTTSEPFFTARCGTPLYVAPEVLAKSCRYDTKADVWSAGVVLFLLLSGYPPFFCSTLKGLLLRIAEGELHFADPAWELVTKEARDFVSALLTKNPEHRLSAAGALAHPWMREAT